MSEWKKPDELEVLWSLTSGKPYGEEPCAFCHTMSPMWMLQWVEEDDGKEVDSVGLIAIIIEDDVFYLTTTEILKIVKCFNCLSYHITTPHMNKYISVAQVVFK